VTVLSQPTLVADSLADYLARRPAMRGASDHEGLRYLTTGDPSRVSDRAAQFLRRPVRFEAA